MHLFGNASPTSSITGSGSSVFSGESSEISHPSTGPTAPPNPVALAHNRHLLNVLLAHPLNGGVSTAVVSRDERVSGAVSSSTASSFLMPAPSASSSACTRSHSAPMSAPPLPERLPDKEKQRENQQRMFSLLPSSMRPQMSSHNDLDTRSLSSRSSGGSGRQKTSRHAFNASNSSNGGSNGSAVRGAGSSERELFGAVRGAASSERESSSVDGAPPLSRLHLLEAAAEQRFLQEQTQRGLSLAEATPALTCVTPSPAVTSSAVLGSQSSHTATTLAPLAPLTQILTQSHNDHNTHTASAVAAAQLSLTTAATKVSDAQTYGPLFCQVFDAFHTHSAARPIDVNRPLMSLCLEHLVEVVQWARESEQRSVWITHTLLENDYLRPETRNGVVMILIYLFAAKKAAVLRGLHSTGQGSFLNENAVNTPIDMFYTLQDSTAGLGIASKFSLKIYSDPWQCVSVLKTLLSALIDAGILPENERQKASTVKEREKERESGVRHTMSIACDAEELRAFEVIKRRLVALFDAECVKEAREVMSEMCDVWQRKGKGKKLRSRRLSLILTSLPHHFSLSHTILSHKPAPTLSLTHNMALTQRRGTTKRALCADSDDESDCEVELCERETERESVVKRARDAEPLCESVETHMTHTPHDTLTQPFPTHPVTHTLTNTDTLSHSSVATHPQIPPTHSLTHNINTTQPCSHNAVTQSCTQTVPHTLSNTPMPPPTLPSLITPRRSLTLRTFCCERVSASEWEVRESVVWDTAAFFASQRLQQQQTLCGGAESLLYLVDETQFLSHNERNTRRLCATYTTHSHTSTHSHTHAHTRLSHSLSQELTAARHCVVAQWQGERERAQCLAFLSLCASLCDDDGDTSPSHNSLSQPRSLLDCWYNHTHNPIPTNVDCHTPMGQGVLVYEEVRKVVLLVRACESLSLGGDVWCSLYADELHTTPSDNVSVTFVDSLSLYFPQLQIALQRIAQREGLSESVLVGRVMVKYLSHSVSVSSSCGVSGVPSLPPLSTTSAYQTLGTLGSPTERVFSRLSPGVLIHDFILELL